MIFYRYEEFHTEELMHIVERTFSLIKETPCGYWIGAYGDVFSWDIKKRWVSKTARKRYAYPTKEEAMNNFIKRKSRQSIILKYRLKDALIAEKLGKKLLKKLEENGNIGNEYAYRNYLIDPFNLNDKSDRLINELTV